MMRSRQLLAEAYRGLVSGLRGRSSAPVYTFPYDWRLSTRVAARQLAEFVRSLQRRKLDGMPPDGAGGVDFVCHSMGGLIFRNFLREWGTSSPLPVNRVVFIGTPQLGSLSAVEAMVRGGVLFVPSMKAIRKIARGFPGVYELLPRLPDAFVLGGSALDIFRVENWQSNVTEPSPRREDVEQGRLDAAKTVLDSMPDPLDPAYGLQGRVLVIYGDKKDSTMRQVPVLQNNAGVRNWFDFERGTKGRGDELVPVESTRLRGAQYVRIPYNSISYMNDLKPRLFNFHAFMTELDEVQTVTGRFLAGDSGVDLLPLNLKPISNKVLGTFS
jgi:pimeloyl-ACP methyl ester carboxylesterase